jgi:hypothetical protein
MRDTETYNELVGQLRFFFIAKGFKEVPSVGGSLNQIPSRLE